MLATTIDVGFQALLGREDSGNWVAGYRSELVESHGRISRVVLADVTAAKLFEPVDGRILLRRLEAVEDDFRRLLLDVQGRSSACRSCRSDRQGQPAGSGGVVYVALRTRP